MPSLSSVVVLAAAVAPAYAFWRMECRGVTGYYRIDPIVSPGVPSKHLHSILGSGAFSETSDTAELLSSDCTSCLVTQDKSAYWHPALYFQDASTGTFELVGQTGGTLAYYLLNYGNGNTNITAFPKDFRMIAGDQDRRSFSVGNVEMVDPPKAEWASLNQTTQEALSQRALGFNCLDYSGTAEASLYRHFFPNKGYLDANCPDGIRFELMFPSCWNGKDLDSDNHRDHVAYPDQVMSGDCPSDFPVRLPGLFYETIWNTPAFSGRDGQFVISNGDIEGFAYHGDFLMGWEDGVLQEAVNTCTSESGEIGDCAIFNIQSQSDAQQCKLNPPSNVASEDAQGPGLASLPGDVALYGSALTASMLTSYDPALSTVRLADATDVAGSGAAATSAVSAAASAVSSAVSAVSSVVSQVAAAAAAAPSSVSTSSSAIEGGVFHANNVDAPSSSSVVVPTTTIAAETSSDTGVVSTQYVTEGNIVTEVLWYEATVYVTEGLSTVTMTNTVTAETATATANAQKRHAHNHMRHHQRRNRL